MNFATVCSPNARCIMQLLCIAPVQNNIVEKIQVGSATPVRSAELRCVALGSFH